jgi:predicted TIM-barrel fold metal-dependent hydrolase
VGFAVPPGACDAHVHVFGDPRKYPFFANRVYTPETAPVTELRSTLDALHIDRVVVVQPSVYGTDNRCTVDAVRELGSRARGIAVIDANKSDAELETMAREGIRGIRLNLTQAGVSDPSAALRGFEAAAARLRIWYPRRRPIVPTCCRSPERWLPPTRSACSGARTGRILIPR